MNDDESAEVPGLSGKGEELTGEFTAGFSGEHLRGAEGWVLIPLAVEALVGTLLWGLFIVSFSRKVIRSWQVPAFS